LTSWVYPDSVRDLNLSNRRMRTRMSGGVGGVTGENSRRPYPDAERFELVELTAAYYLSQAEPGATADACRRHIVQLRAET
jgi:hypothetical protein